MYTTIILGQNYLQIVRSNYVHVYFGQINESVCLSLCLSLSLSLCFHSPNEWKLELFDQFVYKLCILVFASD